MPRDLSTPGAPHPNAGTLQQPPLRPTHIGYLKDTMDALVLLSACLNGDLNHVPRRPHDKERAELIRSGHIFIYEENASGIKRWTDGMSWSPSRILGNYLIYRELDKPFPAGEKKRAMKKTPSNGTHKAAYTRPNSRSNSVANMHLPPTLSMNAHQSRDPLAMYATGNHANPNEDKDSERALVGSLVDSYQFKDHGLVKKTISIQYKGITHHIVSYYSVEDIHANRFETPTQAPQFTGVKIREELFQTAFRAPLHDSEIVVASATMEPPTTQLPYYPGHSMAPAMPPSMMGGNMNSGVGRSMSVPNIVSFPTYQWGVPPPQTSSSPAASGYMMNPSPFNGGSHLGSSHLASSQFGNSHLAGSQLGSSHLASSHLASSLSASTQFGSSHLGLHGSEGMPSTTTSYPAALYTETGSSVDTGGFSGQTGSYSHKGTLMEDDDEYESPGDLNLNSFIPHMNLPIRRRSDMNGHQESTQHQAQMPFNDTNGTHGLDMYDNRVWLEDAADSANENFNDFSAPDYGGEANQLGDFDFSHFATSNSMQPGQLQEPGQGRT